MFFAQKFCRIEQYNLLGRGEIRSAQGHVLCGSAFARYVHVLKENTMISGARRLRKIVFFRFFQNKLKRNANISEALGFGKNFVRENGNNEHVTEKNEKTAKLKTHKLERGEAVFVVVFGGAGGVGVGRYRRKGFLMKMKFPYVHIITTYSACAQCV